jgi:hypothetical protein
MCVPGSVIMRVIAWMSACLFGLYAIVRVCAALDQRQALLVYVCEQVSE